MTNSTPPKGQGGIVPATVASRGASAGLPRLSSGAAGSRGDSRWPLIVFAICSAHLLFPVLWLVGLWRFGPIANDWLHLKIVADHFVAGDHARLYATGEQAINPGYYWRYPPFSLYSIAPLAWLSRNGAYTALAITGVGALTLTLVILTRLAPWRRWKPEGLAAVVAAAPTFTALVTGQHAGVIALILTSAALCWHRGRSALAGASLGLLAFKPNWLAFLVLMLIALRQWRSLAGVVAVGALLVLATAPLGVGLWADFVHISKANSLIVAAYESHKLITVHGFLLGVLGPGPAATGLWLISWIVLLPAAALAWRSEGPMVWKLGIGVLLAVALNPYASFYDALVLIIPAAVAGSSLLTWRPRRLAAVLVLVALAWLGEHLSFSWLMLLEHTGNTWTPAFSVVGPVCAVWLLLEVSEARYRAQSNARIAHENLNP